MYFWVGIIVDEELSALREKAEKVEREVGISLSCFTLPLHVSLKISFKVDEEKSAQILENICELYENLEPFELKVKGIENEGNIVWLRYEENPLLSNLKTKMNEALKERFGIGLHEYDKDFIFHTTLFMGDEEKNTLAFEKVKGFSLPTKVKANRFAIGFSENGELGTFKILKEVKK